MDSLAMQAPLKSKISHDKFLNELFSSFEDWAIIFYGIFEENGINLAKYYLSLRY
jgi:hypothetical protein